jgi:hypothetical protein
MVSAKNAVQAEVDSKLKQEIVAYQAALEEAEAMIRFLRSRTADLNQNNKMLRARVTELENENNQKEKSDGNQ